MRATASLQTKTTFLNLQSTAKIITTNKTSINTGMRSHYTINTSKSNPDTINTVKNSMVTMGKINTMKTMATDTKTKTNLPIMWTTNMFTGKSERMDCRIR